MLSAASFYDGFFVPFSQRDCLPWLTVLGREWQRSLMRALRLSVPRPPTSDSVLPMLLVVSGLVPPHDEMDPSIAAGQSSQGGLQPVGTTPSALAPLQPTAAPTLGGQNAASAMQGQQQECVPPSMSRQEVLEALPPRATQSVWLAAFLAELKAQWGMGRVL
ncbi:hypothetical protein DUNSADRAFT_15295 [Dunaliella salina]|uniref:Encoded protein n=1 Tax=Dunaliella salina TaxID=3046 RepID=A0ABQ7G5P5_DUNSA|nr:hypothetical protein DUNSADRAFT_15295 [Dunaliella salina]|eukprot:KAF5829939.1 hypothetical protein DUNSADRAFT_15295 [Dunaliella salina]